MTNNFQHHAKVGQIPGPPALAADPVDKSAGDGYRASVNVHLLSDIKPEFVNDSVF